MNPYSEADLYCAAFDYPIESEVDHILDVITSLLGRSPRSVFEPMCGSARYGPVMVRKGLDYVGFDLSEDMLARASGETGVKTLVADAADFSLDAKRFDLAMCPINSIRHLPDFEALASHLDCVHRHLVKGGIYWIETNLADWDGPFEENAVEWAMPQADGSTVAASWWRVRGERKKGRMIEGCRFRRLVDEKVVEEIEHEYDMLMTSRAVWENQAEKAGFKIVSTHLQKHDGWTEVSPATIDDNHPDNHAICLRAIDR